MTLPAACPALGSRGHASPYLSCWADPDEPQKPWEAPKVRCGSITVDDIGLCPRHRLQIVGRSAALRAS